MNLEIHFFSVPVSVEAPSLAPGQITTGIPGQQSKPKNVKSDEDKPPKSKKIKADEDIPGFAAAGCLTKKATIGGLRNWLASVGVPTKSRSKKDELVQMALDKLGYASAIEQVEFEQ